MSNVSAFVTNDCTTSSVIYATVGCADTQPLVWNRRCRHCIKVTGSAANQHGVTQRGACVYCAAAFVRRHNWTRRTFTDWTAAS